MKTDWHESDRRFLRGLQLSTLPELVRAWTKCHVPWRKAAIARAIAKKKQLSP